MKLTSNKIFSFMLAAAFALTLAGCGGGGSAAVEEPPAMPEMCPEGQVGTPPDCMEPGPTPEEIAAQEEAEALEAAQDAAMMAAYMAAMSVRVAARRTPWRRRTRTCTRRMAKTASDAAAMAMTSEMAMEHQMAAETARDKRDGSGRHARPGLITTEANQITNKSRHRQRRSSRARRATTFPSPFPTRGEWARSWPRMAADAAEQTAVTDGPGVEAGSVSQGAPAASATVAYGANGPTITVAGVGTTLLLR